MTKPFPTPCTGIFLSGIVAFAIALSGLSAKSFAFTVPLAGLLIFFKIGRKNIIWPKGLVVFAGTLAACALLSSLWSVDTEESLKHALRLLPLLLGGVLFVASCMSARTKDIKPQWVMAGWLFSLCVLLTHNATGFETWRFLNNLPENETIFPHVLNKSTGILTVLLLPCLALLYSSDLTTQKKKTLMALALIGFGILLALSGSQSCQLAIPVMALFYFLFPAKSKKALKILGAFLCLCILAAPFIAFAAFEPLAALGKSNDWMRAGSVSERLEIWHFIALKIFENPITGFGMEAARLIPHFDTQKIYFGVDVVLHPHNGILQLWLEFGIFGALIGCAAVTLILRSIGSIGDPVVQRLALATFMGMLLIGSIGWGMWQGWWVATLFAATGVLALAARCAADR